MSHPKTTRNKMIVKLRRKDPKKWTFGKLAQEFGFKSRSTAKEIFETFCRKF